MYSKVAGRLGFVVFVSGVIIACGREKGPEKPSSPPERPVNLSSPEQIEISPEAAQELMVATSLTTGNAQARCSDILTQGVMNRHSRSISESGRRVIFREYCNMDEGVFIDRLFKKLNQSSSDEQASHDEGGGGFEIIGIVGASGHGASTNSSSSDRQWSHDEAKELGLKWRQENCGSSGDDNDQRLHETEIVETVEPEIIRAWRDCTTSAKSGLLCTTTRTESLVTLSLEWRPNELQRKHLPRVALKWNNLSNVKTNALELPKQLGIGSALSVTFEPEDQKQPTSIEVFAGDSQGLVNFGCNANLPAQRKIVVRQHPQCGVETYKKSSGAVCGPPRFNAGSGEICGIEKSRLGNGPVCGAAVWNRRQDRLCGSDWTSYAIPMKDFIPFEPAASILMMPLIMAGGLEQLCKQNQRFSEENPLLRILGVAGPSGIWSYDHWRIRDNRVETVCKIEVIRECQHESFGAAEWRNCEHPDFGVESWKTCEHESFGVAAWPECRHESFGVESWKTCEIEEENPVGN
jgi:hypothetical protein